ncbi:MAG TPA: tetratricopeptide repeat protein [Kineosporiaceae bacterium]|nr:tetratricopeptide repeat protein [Kineosporiaceae bacterium]
MTLTDVRGLPVTASSSAAVAGFDRALELLLSFTGDPIGAIEEALAIDSSFLLGHCLRADLMLLGTDKLYLPEAIASLERAEALAGGGTEREQWHVAAVRAWVDGQFERAADCWERALLLAPRDALALIAAHQADFFLGASQSLRDRIARVLPEWDADTPGYGFVLGMYAFGLEEMGDYAAAEQHGRHAVALYPRDAWAIHAVAHTYEMQGRTADGIGWLTAREDDWARDNFFAVHNWWHLSLYHLELEQPKAVLDIYDTRIRGEPSSAMLDLLDASALLWRLHLSEVDTGERWTEVADTWRGFADDRWYTFNDLHAMLAFAAVGAQDDAERLLTALAEVATGTTTNARMAREVGLAEARGLWAFGTGDYARALADLMPIRFTAARAGGSHAQRDLLQMTCVETAHRAGEHRLARALLNERLALKPFSPHNWLWLARALSAGGDPAGAASARDRADALRTPAG